MKKILFVFIIIISVATIVHAQSNDEKKVATAVETLRKAMIDANKQQLESIVSDELSYGHSSGKIEDKAAFIDALVSGRSDFLTMELAAQTIKITGKTAIVRHNVSGNINDNGIPGTVKIGVMLVWQLDHGKWKLLARQAYKLP